MQAEILTLTTDMLALCGGLDLGVCVGAALNTLATLFNHAPNPEIREGIARHMRMITDNLSVETTGTKH